MKRLFASVIALVMLASVIITSAVSCTTNSPADTSVTTNLPTGIETQTNVMASVKSIADLAGMKISAQSGTFHEEARAQISNVKGELYPDFPTLLTALSSGAIDGYIAEEPTALDLVNKDSRFAYIHLENNTTGFTATDADVAIAVGCKTGSELIGKINDVLATISESDRKALMEEVIRVNAGETVESFSVSNEAPAETNGVIKIAMECAYDPFNWTQTTSANNAYPISGDSSGFYANGYDVQIAKYIANALGMKLEIQAIEWDGLISGVQAGTFDCIIAGMSPTAERDEEIDFTDVYYTSNLVVIYKK